jgi:hypothetical protein
MTRLFIPTDQAGRADREGFAALVHMRMDREA